MLVIRLLGAVTGTLCFIFGVSRGLTLLNAPNDVAVIGGAALLTLLTCIYVFLIRVLIRS